MLQQAFPFPTLLSSSPKVINCVSFLINTKATSLTGLFWKGRDISNFADLGLAGGLLWALANLQPARWSMCLCVCVHTSAHR